MSVHLTSPADLALLLGDAACNPDARSGYRVLVRQYGRVMSAWSGDLDEDDDADAVTVYGEVIFGGPPAPDVGDDIASWYISQPVEVIGYEELREMRLAAAADEAARPVFGLGDRGEIVVAPDGSTVLAAEDDPTLGYRRARGVVKGDEPAEDIIRRMRDDAPTVQLHAGDVYIPLAGEKRERTLEVMRASVASVDQLGMRRRTLARFARDYAKAFEDGEDPDVLGLLENNLQVAVRRVLELTDP